MNPNIVETVVNVLKQADGVTVAAVTTMVTGGLIAIGAGLNRLRQNRQVQDYRRSRQYQEDMSGDGGL